jgi:hypothetical protein
MIVNFFRLSIIDCILYNMLSVARLQHPLLKILWCGWPCSCSYFYEGLFILPEFLNLSKTERHGEGTV